MSRDSAGPDGDLERLVTRARQGDRAALEEVVRAIQDRVYGLALRMLWHPEDARDAAQEILVRVVTRLASFRGESRFTTWVYSIATRHLLNVRRSRLERERYDFERFGADLADGLADDPRGPPSPERALLLEEVKVGCTLALLSCLDRPHRVAYVLGEILELDSPEAARVLGIEPPAFRKRLQRARRAVVSFTRDHCGLLHPERACRCHRRLPRALQRGRVDPDRLLFATSAQSARRFPEVLERIRSLEESRRAAALYRSLPEPRAPQELADSIRGLIASL